MRLRSVVGACVVAAGLVAAIVVLRAPPSPTVPSSVADSQPAPVPVIDGRAKQLTAHFRDTTLLPDNVRFADDPNSPPGFEFRRFVDIEVNIRLVRYVAEGNLVRTRDNAVLDHVLVNVWRADGRDIQPTDLAMCQQGATMEGASCTQARLPGGVLAEVLRNPVFAQTVASDSTTGSPPGLMSELQVVYPNSTVLTVSLFSLNDAGIPLDDAAMLNLARMPGISGR